MEKGKDGKKIINIDLDDEENENNAQPDPEPDPAADADGDLDDSNETLQSTAETSNLQSESGTSNVNNKKNKKITKAVKDVLTSIGTKFMSNFDPELSNRERRKLTRKFNAEGKKLSVVDENGGSNTVEKDVCDCLNEDCPGCHFPCPKCRSCKCGIECKVNRKWTYEAIENEADSIATKNPIASIS